MPAYIGLRRLHTVLIGINCSWRFWENEFIANGCTKGTLRNVWRKRVRNFRNEVLRYKEEGRGVSQTSLGVPVVQLEWMSRQSEKFRDRFVDAALSLAARTWEDVRFMEEFFQERSDIPEFCLASSSNFHIHMHPVESFSVALRWRINLSHLAVEWKASS